ncbi:tetratricopeptide repeat protein [Acetivibrio saccincola]|uniref:tetratricopeptide repeat protein n=1 Tax=Acetivibrio saccincola TaxID=1677857 RepID=UPI00169718CF|nr:tetratricopeptide repeat protein [Acetivibrio saccincola]NLW27464.1 sel1 repeat family protein [Acetivibrio saccincola]
MVIENRGKLQHEAEELSILGDKFYARNDFSAAVSCYQKAAELGDKLAQYNLALMYEEGKGVEVNHAKAVYWYKKAADSGLPEAQINLALCYYWGTGYTT